MMRKIALPLVICASLLIGCSGNLTETPQAATSAPTASVQNAYPSAEMGYPAGTTLSSESENVIPTMPSMEMTEGTGGVEGQLLLNGVPVPGANLFLASFIKDSNGNEYVASVSPHDSPFAVTDTEGNFRFINVPANRYGLVIEDVNQSFILLSPKDGSELVAEVNDQQVLDLGKLDYADLPIHQP
jgi:hypothetical protein